MCCKMTYFAQILLAICGALALGLVYSLPADETDVQAKSLDAKTARVKGTEKNAPLKDQPGKPDASGLVKLAKDHDVWLDLKRKAVVVDGEVCLREGQLEMFACPKGTKEHESIVSLNCQAQDVHAGLLAAGAKPGKPVIFDPEYKPAEGQIVDIYVLWKDEEGGKHQTRAQ